MSRHLTELSNYRNHMEFGIIRQTEHRQTKTRCLTLQALMCWFGLFFKASDMSIVEQGYAQYPDQRAGSVLCQATTQKFSSL